MEKKNKTVKQWKRPILAHNWKKKMVASSVLFEFVNVSIKVFTYIF